MEKQTESSTPLEKSTEVEAVVDQTLNPKKLEIIPNWKSVFFTWSFYFHCSSVILTFIEQILPFFSLLEPTMTVQTYSICMFVLNGLGLFSRFIKQKSLWVYHPEQNREVPK